MTRERRRYERHPIEIPINVCTDQRRDRAGVTRDVSRGGMLFHSRSKFAVGERLALQFKNSTTAGRVVRAEVDPNIDSFPYLTAVKLDVPLIDLDVEPDESAADRHGVLRSELRRSRERCGAS